jgi:hypothetical protein
MPLNTELGLDGAYFSSSEAARAFIYCLILLACTRLDQFPTQTHSSPEFPRLGNTPPKATIANPSGAEDGSETFDNFALGNSEFASYLHPST